MLETFLATEPWIRIPVYMAFGCVAEVIFTALNDLLYPSYLCSWNVFSKGPPTSTKPDWFVPGRDPRLRGYTFLWMFPIYGLLVVLEPIHQAIAAWPWILRGLLYVVLIWSAEFVSGFLIKKLTGRCPWDYSYAKDSVQGYIRWSFAPTWFVFGFLFEYFYPRFVALTPYFKEFF